jgi:hypothetical protein
VAHKTTGQIYLWPMNGTTRTSKTLMGTVSDVGDRIVGVADHTGNGKGRPAVAPRRAR